MKNRQKRDQLQRASHSGHRAGLRGLSSGGCPYSANPKRAEWIGGWRQGHYEYVSGYVGAQQA